MGNKNATPPKGPGGGPTQKDGEVCIDSATGNVSGDGPPGPSLELLASLQSLRDSSDYTLLPHSLHQIPPLEEKSHQHSNWIYATATTPQMAEAYSLKEDYQWAIQFLQLEKLYHERLLSNLDTLQENWESQLREKKKPESGLPDETYSISQEHMETLSQICRTHLRPSISVEQNEEKITWTDILSKNETLPSCHEKVNKLETTQQDEEQDHSTKSSDSEGPSPQTGLQEGRQEEDGGEDDEGHRVDEEEEETCDETPEDEEVKVEWPTGVPQASDKDLAKLSDTEGSSAPDCLVSILKRRRASLDGLPPPSDVATKQNSKRKVRFSEPEDGIEQDEVGGDSCLILLLLCLVTVVISIGGTALYCTLVDTYSNICTDFAQNVDFYLLNIRKFFEGLGHWLPLRT